MKFRFTIVIIGLAIVASLVAQNSTPPATSQKRAITEVLVECRVAGFASVEHPQHVGYEEDQQYGAQPYARTPTITPAAMAVVPSTAP